MKKKFLFSLFVVSVLHAETKTIEGFVENGKTNAAVEKAKICDAKQCVKSEKNGYFTLQSNSNVFHIVAPGYKRYRFNPTSKKIHMLTPFTVHGVYLTFWGAHRKSKTFKNILSLADASYINSVVIDVKNEFGDILFKTSSKEALQNGAFKNRQVYHIDEYIQRLKKRNLYLIARIVVFKDEYQAINNPEYAIKKDQKLWRNHDNIAWVDPFSQKAWKYALDVAVAAAEAGFDEINFDYIRFPAKQGLALQDENTMEKRLKTIAAFLVYANKRLRPYGVFLSVDTYGNICWNKNDTNIGQTIENFAPYVDYIAPMLYPSSFACGTMGYAYPAEHPYEMIFKSLKNASKKIQPHRLRPWIQAFRDYSKLRKRYDACVIAEELRAARDANTSGWVFWSPSSKYDVSYFDVNLSKSCMQKKKLLKESLKN